MRQLPAQGRSATLWIAAALLTMAWASELQASPDRARRLVDPQHEMAAGNFDANTGDDDFKALPASRGSNDKSVQVAQATTSDMGESPPREHHWSETLSWAEPREGSALKSEMPSRWRTTAFAVNPAWVAVVQRRSQTSPPDFLHGEAVEPIYEDSCRSLKAGGRATKASIPTLDHQSASLPARCSSRWWARRSGTVNSSLTFCLCPRPCANRRWCRSPGDFPRC